MRRAALLIALLPAACAQGPTLDQRLSTFIGRPEGDPVAQFGVPARVHEADGRRFLQYEQRRTVAFTEPGLYQPWYGPWHGPRYGPWGPRMTYVPAPPSYAVFGCDITFALRQGRVESFTFRGEGC